MKFYIVVLTILCFTLTTGQANTSRTHQMMPSQKPTLPIQIIKCNNGVVVFAASAPYENMNVEIKFLSNGQIKIENGILKINKDASLSAKSENAFVKGNPWGNGYNIISPASDPYPANCSSFAPAP